LPQTTALPRFFLPALAGLALLLASANLFWFAQPLLPDSSGFLNPILEFAWTGESVYPAHGPDHAEMMVVHPPVYSSLIGMLVAGGLRPMHAIGLLLLCLYVLVVVAALLARVPDSIRLAIIFGAYVGVFVLPRIDGFRPETAMTLAWIGALTWLLAAESRKFPAPLVVFGSALLAFASSVHYVGWPAIAGAAAFLLPAWRRGRQTFIRTVCCVGIGLSAYLIPYVAAFVWPEREGIAAILRGTDSVVPLSAAGLREALEAHLDIYADAGVWASNAGGAVSLFHGIVRAIDLAGFVALALAYLFVIIHRPTRTFGLAALALTLPILLLVGRKWPFYLKPEFFILAFAVLLVADKVLRALPGLGTKYGAVACWGFIAAVCVTDNRVLSAARGQGALDELAVPRALGKEIVGRDATVGGRSVLTWFTSGASRYRFVTSDLIYPPDIGDIDPAAYFRDFDAIVEEPQGSWVTYNRQKMSLPSFYTAGHLRFAGLYSPRFNVGYGGAVAWFTPRPVTTVRAVYYRNGTPLEFREGSGTSVLSTVRLASSSAGALERCGREIARFQLPDAAYLSVLIGDGRLRSCAAECRSCAVVDSIDGEVRSFPVDRYEDAVNYRSDRVAIFYDGATARAARAVAAGPPRSFALKPAATATSRDGSRFATADAVQSGALAHSDVLALTAGTYRVDAAVTVDRGSLAIIAYNPDTQAELYRRYVSRTRSARHISFLFTTSGQTFQLTVVGNNVEPTQIEFTMGSLSITPVAAAR
jgi:hypothetical protein